MKTKKAKNSAPIKIKKIPYNPFYGETKAKSCISIKRKKPDYFMQTLLNRMTNIDNKLKKYLATAIKDNQLLLEKINKLERSLLLGAPIKFKKIKPISYR